jgi:ABC-2 type transport system ATP-binding protein
LLRADGVVVRDLGVHRPSLDDVFLALTGHAAHEGDVTDGAGDGGPATEPAVSA